MSNRFHCILGWKADSDNRSISLSRQSAHLIWLINKNFVTKIYQITWPSSFNRIFFFIIQFSAISSIQQTNKSFCSYPVSLLLSWQQANFVYFYFVTFSFLIFYLPYYKVLLSFSPTNVAVYQHQNKDSKILVSFLHYLLPNANQENKIFVQSFILEISWRHVVSFSFFFFWFSLCYFIHALYVCSFFFFIFSRFYWHLFFNLLFFKIRLVSSLLVLIPIKHVFISNVFFLIFTVYFKFD